MPDPDEGDQTRKVRIAVHSEMRTVKRIQFWATLAVVVAGVGFGAAMYLNRYAQASDLEKLADKAEVFNRQFNSHVTIEASRMTAIEVQGKNIEADYHWQREQLQRIADRVGAARVPPPKHKESP